MPLDATELLKSKSQIVEVSDNFLETEVLEEKFCKLREMTAQELFDLAYQFDASLEAQRMESPLLNGCVVPMIYPMDFATFEPDITPDFWSFERLTLVNDQVAVPISDVQNMVYDLSNGERQRKSDVVRVALKRLVAWIDRNRTFIERGIVVPYPVDVYNTEAVLRMTGRMADQTPIPKRIKRASQIAPVRDEIVEALGEVEEEIRVAISNVYDEMFMAKAIGAVPVAVDPYTATLWDALLAEGARSKLTPVNDPAISRALMRLKLPKLDELTHDDIIALRSNSEAFAIWRDRLRSVLSGVASKVEAGGDLDRVMTELGLPLKEAARQIASEMRRSTISTKIGSLKTSVTLGAAGLMLSHGIMKALEVQPSTLRDIIKLGPAALVPFLHWLLFQRPSKDQQAVLRIYEAFNFESSAK